MDAIHSLRATCFLAPLFVLLLHGSKPLLGTGATSADFPFRNITLSWEERAVDLMSRLTLGEVVAMLARGGGGTGAHSPAVPRLGVQPFQFNTACWGNGVQGHNATAFVSSIGLGATFSTAVASAVARAVAVEARGVHHWAAGRGDYGSSTGPACLGPFVNIVHHPLWGRIQEVYGEDPYHSGELAAAWVGGAHGDHPRYRLSTAACVVLAAYSGPENIPVSRFSFNAKITAKDLELTYLPHFARCLSADVDGLMCSYTAVNGVPSCASSELLDGWARRRLGFRGWVISDESAIENTFQTFNYTHSKLEAAATCLNAGVNLEQQPGSGAVFEQLAEAVKHNLTTEQTVRGRLVPLLVSRLRMGEFDPPRMNPFSAIDESVLQSAAHRALATHAAVQSLVLLKNLNKTLPVLSVAHTIAVVGPFSDKLSLLYGGYTPAVMPEFGRTPYAALRSLGQVARVAAGCEGPACTRYTPGTVRAAVTGADFIFVCIGTGMLEREGRDRRSLALPGNQSQLLNDTTLYGRGARVVVLNFSPGPVDLAWAQSSPLIHSIVQCFLPAQATGDALYRVIAALNDDVTSPAGRLSITWPKSLSQIPPITQFNMTEQTYRYFKGSPLYPFGYGLSYTTFRYSNLWAPTNLRAEAPLKLNVTVTNTGSHGSDEVTQVYISWLTPPSSMPQRQLVAFQRYYVPASSSSVRSFIVTSQQRRVWQDGKGLVAYTGVMSVSVGGQQPDQAIRAPSNVLIAHIHSVS